MGKSANMNIVSVEGTTGFADTNFNNKVAAAIHELKNQDVVYLNVTGSRRYFTQRKHRRQSPYY